MHIAHSTILRASSGLLNTHMVITDGQAQTQSLVVSVSSRGYPVSTITDDNKQIYLLRNYRQLTGTT